MPTGAKRPAKPRNEAKGGKVELLAGGNPRIAKGDGEAPVQAYIAAMPGWKRTVGAELDALITYAVPHVRKAVKWNSPLYGVEGQGWFLAMHVFTRYVKVTFFKGAALKPLPPGKSTQKDVRHLDVHEGEAIDARLFTQWVKQAARIPGWGA